MTQVSAAATNVEVLEADEVGQQAWQFGSRAGTATRDDVTASKSLYASMTRRRSAMTRRSLSREQVMRRIMNQREAPSRRAAS